MRRIIANSEAYENYKSNPDYKDCKFNWINGGLKATHKGHSFDPNKGHYEKEVQEVGFKNGHRVVLENEKNGEDKQRFAEGLWNGKTFEIGTSLGVGNNNIKHILNHCKDKDAKIAVIYFPKEELFTRERLFDGIYKYNGQAEYRFEQIIYIVGENINYINKKSHPIKSGGTPGSS